MCYPIVINICATRDWRRSSNICIAVYSIYSTHICLSEVIHRVKLTNYLYCWWVIIINIYIYIIVNWCNVILFIILEFLHFKHYMNTMKKIHWNFNTTLIILLLIIKFFSYIFIVIRYDMINVCIVFIINVNVNK